MNRIRLSSPFVTRALQVLMLAVLVAGASVTTAYAQDDQEYKKAYNAGLEAYKAKNLDGAYDAWTRAATLAQQAGDTEIAGKANYYVAQLDYKRGLAAIKAEQFAKALEHFEDGAERYPDYAKNYLGRGLALKKLNRTEEAMDAFAQTMEVSERVNDRKTGRSAEDAIRDNYLYLASSKLTESGARATRSAAEQAIAHLNKLDERLGLQADGFYYMAVAYEALGNVEQTTSFAAKALAENPSRSDSARIHLLLGELYMQQGDFAQAREHLNQATYGDAKARAEALLGQLGTQ